MISVSKLKAKYYRINRGKGNGGGLLGIVAAGLKNRQSSRSFLAAETLPLLTYGFFAVDSA